MDGAHRYGLDDLYAFGLVVESRGLRSAARRHAPSRPSLARSIERLEAAAGGSLLERESAGFVLTPLGERLAVEGERAVRLARETATALRDGADDAGGCLRVGADGPGATVLAASALAELSLDRPALRARLLRVDADADPSRERLDALLTTGRPPSGSRTLRPRSASSPPVRGSPCCPACTSIAPGAEAPLCACCPRSTVRRSPCTRACRTGGATCRRCAPSSTPCGPSRTRRDRRSDDGSS